MIYLRALCGTLTLAVLLVGCSGLYAKAGKAFSEGLESTAAVVSTDLQQHERVARLEMITAVIYAGSSSKDDKALFIDYVCAGAIRAVNQLQPELVKEGMEVLKAYGKSINEMATAPKDDIGPLLGSIGKWMRANPALPEVEKPDKDGHLKSPQEREQEKAKARWAAAERCRKQFDAEGLLPPYSTVTIKVVPGAALLALPALLKALEAAAVAILKITDEAVRTEKLREFVAGSEETVTQLFDKQLSVTNLTFVLREHKLAALSIPYHEFLALREAIQSPGTKGAAHRAELFAAADRIHGHLAEFDILTTRGPVEQLFKNVRLAQEHLVKLARGEVTAEDAFEALMGFARSMKDAVDKIQAAQKEADKVAKAVR